MCRVERWDYYGLNETFVCRFIFKDGHLSYLRCQIVGRPPLPYPIFFFFNPLALEFSVKVLWFLWSVNGARLFKSEDDSKDSLPPSILHPFVLKSCLNVNVFCFVYLPDTCIWLTFAYFGNKISIEIVKLQALSFQQFALLPTWHLMWWLILLKPNYKYKTTNHSR